MWAWKPSYDCISSTWSSDASMGRTDTVGGEQRDLAGDRPVKQWRLDPWILAAPDNVRTKPSDSGAVRHCELEIWNCLAS